MPSGRGRVCVRPALLSSHLSSITGGTEPADAPRAAPATGRTLPSAVPADGARTDPLGVLPSDLASLVLGFIPLRPRMLSVSLVSKRWRTAVLRSVRTFRPWRRLYSATSDQPRAPLTSAELEGTLRLFPSLTDLALGSLLDLGGATLRLPTTLRTLRFCYGTEFQLAPPLPSALTSLETLSSSRWEAIATAALLAASATSLASLGLHKLGPELTPLLECTHFPSLTSVTLACNVADPLAMSAVRDRLTHTYTFTYSFTHSQALILTSLDLALPQCACITATQPHTAQLFSPPPCHPVD